MSKLQIDRIRARYEALGETSTNFRTRLGRPLTYAEKILFLHLHDSADGDLTRGESSAFFEVDRVAMQDVTAQMVMLQFMLTGKQRSAVPATIHCDHLIRAKSGSVGDLTRATDEHAEVYRLLRSCAERYGLGFWEPGSGILMASTPSPTASSCQSSMQALDKSSRRSQIASRTQGSTSTIK